MNAAIYFVLKNQAIKRECLHSKEEGFAVFQMKKSHVMKIITTELLQTLNHEDSKYVSNISVIKALSFKMIFCFEIIDGCCYGSHVEYFVDPPKTMPLQKLMLAFGYHNVNSIK